MLVVAAGLAACGGPGAMSGPEITPQSREEALQRVYRLGIGDKLKITVFGEENLTGRHFFQRRNLADVEKRLHAQKPIVALGFVK